MDVHSLVLKIRLLEMFPGMKCLKIINCEGAFCYNPIQQLL